MSSREEASLRVLGYVRVSTDEQADSRAGIEAQRAAIVAECGRRGWEIIEVVEDLGVSGKSLKRPGITTALEILERGDADALVVAKLDRLSRSMLDFAGLMATAERQSWALVALDVAVDTSSPAGEAMAHVMCSFAQFERRLIGQRTKEALAIKKAQGIRLGRPPALSDAVIRRIHQERAAGLTQQAIADALNAAGVPTARGTGPWRPSTISWVLRRYPASEKETH